jgi:hypothetical protein
MSAWQHRVSAAGEWLRGEFIAARPVFIFFLVAFLLQLSIIKLAVAQFSIPVSALSKAIVGALFAAKAVLILDETPLARSLERYRRVIAVAAKTLLYGFATLLLGFVERLLEARHRVGTFGGGFTEVVHQANIYRFFAWVLGISLIFAIYFVFSEINKRMGEGALWSLFFHRP